MSRSGTATPPAAYFPQKAATGSIRHSAPTSSNAHLNKHSSHHKRSRKHAAGPTQKAKSSGLPEHGAMDMSFEDISANDVDLYKSHNQSTTSFSTFQSANSMPGMEHDVTTGSYLTVSSGAPSFYTTHSATNTPLVTPNQSDISLSPVISTAEDLISSSCSESNHTPIPTGRTSSWTSNIGKMAKAVVHTGKSMGIAFGEKKRKDTVSAGPVVVSHPVEEGAETLQIPSAAQEVAQAEPQVEQGHHLSKLCNPHQDIDRRQMLVAQHPRIFECARLCSQWPESGYQKSKFGPHGKLPANLPAQADSQAPKHFTNPQRSPTLTGSLILCSVKLSSKLTSLRTLLATSPVVEWTKNHVRMTKPTRVSTHTHPLDPVPLRHFSLKPNKRRSQL
jgi:hypothetical protein